jgi:hypothetical protein
MHLTITEDGVAGMLLASYGLVMTLRDRRGETLIQSDERGSA